MGRSPPMLQDPLSVLGPLPMCQETGKLDIAAVQQKLQSHISDYSEVRCCSGRQFYGRVHACVLCSRHRAKRPTIETRQTYTLKFVSYATGSSSYTPKCPFVWRRSPRPRRRPGAGIIGGHLGFHQNGVRSEWQGSCEAKHPRRAHFCDPQHPHSPTPQVQDMLNPEYMVGSFQNQDGTWTSCHLHDKVIDMGFGVDSRMGVGRVCTGSCLRWASWRRLSHANMHHARRAGQEKVRPPS